MSLISTPELAARLAADAPRLRLFDATVHLRPANPGPYTVESGRSDHEAAHIPTAAFADLSGAARDHSAALLAHLQAQGVRATGLYRLRFVTHMDVNVAGVDRAVAAIRQFFRA